MTECLASTCPAKPKRKKTFLSIGKSIVSDIKKNRDKILCFKQEMCDMGMSKKASDESWR